MTDGDIIIAPSSAVQGGSVNLIRLSGKGSVSLVNSLFSKDIEKSDGGRFYFGQLRYKQTVIDDVIVYIFRAPHSFTGEEVVEISCHGNFFITESILNACLNLGCRLADPGEFSRRAFMNGKMDLLQAEAIADLIAAKNKNAVKHSLNQLHGGLSERINEIKNRILHLSALVELDIDFSEEEIDIIPFDEVRTQLDAIVEDLQKLLDTYSTGKRFTTAAQVLLFGKPNVGKSSLMNAIINRERVIVSGQPGTTRDHIHEDILIKDHLVRLTDSAGIRKQAGEIEQAGVERSIGLIDDAVLILLVVDISQPPDDSDLVVLQQLNNRWEKTLIVANKSDLTENPAMDSFLKQQFPEKQMIKISARKRENIDRLLEKIGAFLMARTEEQEHIITNVRQYNLIKQCAEQLKETRQALTYTTGPEFLAVDFRTAINFLGELTGEVTTDDILNHIFAHFCIGK